MYKFCVVGFLNLVDEFFCFVTVVITLIHRTIVVITDAKKRLHVYLLTVGLTRQPMGRHCILRFEKASLSVGKHAANDWIVSSTLPIQLLRH